MDVGARLIGSVRLPGAVALVEGPPHGAPAGRLALRRGDRLEVYGVAALFADAPGPDAGLPRLEAGAPASEAGLPRPEAVFPAPWPGWDRGVDAVAPDGSFAVFSGQRAVRAVAAGGRVLWEHRHGCWGPVVGHPHTGDEQEVCAGLEHGSVHVSADGRTVRAHVVDADGTEQWVVLDARDGRETARTPLEDSAASGSHQFSLPDDGTVLLCIGMGQDGVLLYGAGGAGGAGEKDGEAGEAVSGVRDLGEDLDRILLDVHPDRPVYLTVEHSCDDLRLHAPDGTVLAGRDASELGEDRCWDYAAGFVDADTVVAAAENGEEEDGPGHWLLDAHSLAILGPIAYPRPATGCVRALGDGTWLTHDRDTDTLSRWGRAEG
ncbi:hypothetical protein [Streptomyces filamentosus]|uniref:hypothetical protein n=1 Tax=Streptomyces filamentosus TaxID=67294 RepID=UPI0012385818|nr:hypothetical protein [Streptomyces filamentosus]KAA6217569.1 hypothetical protein CP979_11935 [Streptomyces filamentosus]